MSAVAVEDCRACPTCGHTTFVCAMQIFPLTWVGACEQCYATVAVKLKPAVPFKKPRPPYTPYAGY